jgi:hypothetical protein
MGLLGRILLILLVVMATEFVANTVLFERASHFALQEDDARRMAEHLVVARRVLERTAQPERLSVAEELSTARRAGVARGEAPAQPASASQGRDHRRHDGVERRIQHDVPCASD